MPKEHKYELVTRWTGNLGAGTSGYRTYSRDHEINSAGKIAPILGSSDPAFRGDRGRYNPEELLLASLSTCHMLWVLHLCADAGIVVTAYQDGAVGIMAENPDGSGQFSSVVLHPEMMIADERRIAEAIALHERAHMLCFIARSVNFSVECSPVVIAAD